MNGLCAISIVIATMNRPESLKRTIASIVKSSSLPEQIVVVDQSKDRKIADLNRNIVHEVNGEYFFQEEASLTKARNYGSEKVNYDTIIFMDDDIELEKETIENVESIMMEQSIALIAGVDLNCPNKDSLLGYLFCRKSYRYKNQGHITKAVYGRIPQKTDKRVNTEWAMGYFFVIRKHLLDRYQLRWDERLVSYGYPEDLDFSYRYCKKAKADGLSCIVDPKVSVHHLVSKEWRETKYAVTCMMIINREYLAYKLGMPWYSHFITRWSNLGMFFMRLFHHDKPFDVIRAQHLCDRYRSDIKKGLLHTELYL